MAVRRESSVIVLSLLGAFAVGWGMAQRTISGGGHALNGGALDTMALLTLGLLVVAAVQASLFVWQLRLLGKSVSDAGRSATAAEISADAATAAVKQSDQTARTQLRGYVGVIAIELDIRTLNDINYQPHQPKAGSRAGDEIRLTMKNFGATPASQVHAWINWIFGPFGSRLPSEFDFPDFGREQESLDLRPIWTKPTLFPGQTRKQPVSVNDARGFHRALRKEGSAFVYGHIDYVDVFGAPHQTLFCFYYDEVTGEFEPHEEHNEAR
jgi:hypothetical protein